MLATERKVRLTSLAIHIKLEYAKNQTALNMSSQDFSSLQICIF